MRGPSVTLKLGVAVFLLLFGATLGAGLASTFTEKYGEQGAAWTVIVVGGLMLVWLAVLCLFGRGSGGEETP